MDNLSTRVQRTLAKHGFMQVNNVQIPQFGREMPPSAIRRERSQDEHSCTIRSFKPWYHWRIFCAHDRLWQHKCSQCERVGIGLREREVRAVEAITWLAQQNNQHLSDD